MASATRMPMLLKLLPAKARFPADKQFSIWLAENDLDALGADDRAALINMAANLSEARAVLSETNRMSWRLIWSEEISARVRSAAKPELTEDFPEKTPVIPDPEANQPAENITSDTRTSKPVSRRSPFFGLSRAGEIEAIYQNPDARTAIGKVVGNKTKAAKEIWSLLLNSVDAGFLISNDVAFAKVTLRTLLPEASTKPSAANIQGRSLRSRGVISSPSAPCRPGGGYISFLVFSRTLRKPEQRGANSERG
jgi:hypothetical protein